MKSDQFVAPTFLRDPARIEGLMACQFIALLIRALVELLVRRSMVDNAITDITIYPEDRPCSAPSAKRILELFRGVTRHHPSTVKLPREDVPTHPQAEQLQLLDLLGISADRYL